MAIAEVGTATTNAAFGQSMELTPPTGLDDGHVLFLAAMYDETNATPGMTINETGWTTDQNITDNNGASRTLIFGYKRITNISGEPSTYTVLSNEGSDRTMRGVMWALSDVDATTQMDAASTTATAANNDGHDPAAIITVTDNAWVLSIMCARANTAGDATEPSGYTIIGETGTGSGTQTYIGVARKLVASNGTEDPGEWTGMLPADPSATADSTSVTAAVRPVSATTAIYAAYHYNRLRNPF